MDSAPENRIAQTVIVADLDGTLAPSKSPLEPAMAKIIVRVLRRYRLAVISGASFDQFEKQFLNHLPAGPAELSQLHLFPTNGSAYYTYDPASGWRQVYREDLTKDEKKLLYDAFGMAIPESGVDVFDPYGRVDILEDRGSQVTFSGRGQEAPLAVKEMWDPREEKRKKIVAILEKHVPQFEIKIGGATSIDITRKGITKAYAIGKIEQYLHVKRHDIVFYGDALFVGGNDASAKEAGVECISVSGPQETQKYFEKLLIQAL